MKFVMNQKKVCQEKGNGKKLNKFFLLHPHWGLGCIALDAAVGMGQQLTLSNTDHRLYLAGEIGHDAKGNVISHI